MSLDNIQLPAFVIAELYRDSLIDPGGQSLKGSTAPGTSLSFLGNNGKNISIIVNDPSSIYLTDESLRFLMGILSACKLTMADIALINIAKQPGIGYNELRKEMNAEKIFLFGVAPADLQLPLAFPHYQVQRYDNQVYLYSPPLEQLEADKAEKIKLWGCLKQIFSI